MHGVRCVRKYTATRSLGRPSGLTKRSATSFGKISLNHEYQARIECRYALLVAVAYPVCVCGSTPLHSPDKIERPEKREREEGEKEKGGGGEGGKEKER